MLARRMFTFPRMGWHMDPFAEMERMRREMDRLTNAIFGNVLGGRYAAGVFPAVNITEDKEQYLVRAELPGIDAQDVDVQVNGRNLSISGERKIPSEGENVKYHRREREAGKFRRVITLPGDIDPDKVEAKMENGVLTITVGKSEAAKPRQITVK